MKPIRVLLDMDGVLVDFAAQYEKINGTLPLNVYQPGASRSPEKELLWNRYVDQAGFEDAPLHAGALDLISHVMTLLATEQISAIEICSSAGGKARHIEVTHQKNVWLKLHDLSFLTAHIVQNGFKKVDVIDNERYHDILIDDTEMVIANFRKHGGYAILHTSASDTIVKLDFLVNKLYGTK
jgi:hypothetical protein